MKARRASAAALALALALGLRGQGVFRLDTAFRTTLEARNVVDALVLPDGDVVVSGALRYAEDPFGQLRGGLRLNPDGTRDLVDFPEVAFMGGMIVPWGDRVYVGNGHTMRRFFADDFAQDPTFQAADPLMQTFQGGDYHVYPDGSVVMTGIHDLYDTAHGFVGSYELVWLTATGRLDTTRTHRNASGYLRTLRQTHDGRFMCWGTGTHFEGHAVPRVFRVLANGAWDSSFVAPFVHYTGYCFGFLPLPDGRCYAAGRFFLPGSTDTLHLVRFMPDGSLDPTFNNAIQFIQNTSLNVNGALLVGVTEYSENRLIVHGNFDHVEGQPRRGVCMIDSTGQVLHQMFPGLGCGPTNYNGSQGNSVDGIAVTPAGDLYIYGFYHGYDDGLVDDTGQRLISRLRLVDIGMGAEEQVGELGLSVHPNPTAGPVQVCLVESPSVGTRWLVVRDALGRVVQREALNRACVNVELRIPGMYLLEVGDDTGRSAVHRVVVER